MQTRIIAGSITHERIGIHIKTKACPRIVESFTLIELGAVRHDHPVTTDLYPIIIQYGNTELVLRTPVTTLITDLHRHEHDILRIGHPIGMCLRHDPETHGIAGLFILIVRIDHVTPMGPPVIELHVNIHVRYESARDLFPTVRVLPGIITPR